MPFPRAIPTISSDSQLKDYLKNYQQTLNQTIESAPTPIAPYNFKVTSARGGAQLSWSALVNPKNPASLSAISLASFSRADGYELQRSATGDFSPGKYIAIPLRDPAQNSYFDAVGGPAQTFYYRLRATNGTIASPYGVHGLFTGVVKITTIDSSDTTTVPVSALDTFTSSISQRRAGKWPNGVQSPFQ